MFINKYQYGVDNYNGVLNEIRIFVCRLNVHLLYLC